MCMAILMQYAIIVNYNWEFNLYNDNSLKCPTVIQSCKMYIRYTPSIIIIHLFKHIAGPHSHVCIIIITIIIIILLYIRSMVSALTYIIALWKASKGKKPLLLVDMQWEPKNWILCWLEMGSSLGGSVTEGPSLHARPFFGFSSTWATGCCLYGFCTALQFLHCRVHFINTFYFWYMFEWKEFI